MKAWLTKRKKELGGRSIYRCYFWMMKLTGGELLTYLVPTSQISLSASIGSIPINRKLSLDIFVPIDWQNEEGGWEYKILTAYHSNDLINPLFRPLLYIDRPFERGPRKWKLVNSKSHQIRIVDLPAIVEGPLLIEKPPQERRWKKYDHMGLDKIGVQNDGVPVGWSEAQDCEQGLFYNNVMVLYRFYLHEVSAILSRNGLSLDYSEWRKIMSQVKENDLALKKLTNDQFEDLNYSLLRDFANLW